MRPTGLPHIPLHARQLVSPISHAGATEAAATADAAAAAAAAAAASESVLLLTPSEGGVGPLILPNLLLLLPSKLLLGLWLWLCELQPDLQHTKNTKLFQLG